jgi:hypothetical protein
MKGFETKQLTANKEILASEEESKKTATAPAMVG